jgi:nitrilase
MRAAAIQMVSGTRVAENLETAARLIAQAAAAGARLVGLPENFALMPAGDAERLAAAERDGAGPIQDFLAAQAKKHRLWLVGGTIPIVSETAPGKVRAACLLYDDRGRRVARYDKIHLFDVDLVNGEQYRESRTIEPGAEPVAVPTPFGRVGLAVCYDLRFPELFRRLLDAAGVEIFIVPSAFTAHTGRAHWETLVRARAIENQAFVIAPGQGGLHANGRRTYGHSLIVDPWGEVLACGPGEGEAVLIARLDPARLATVRAAFPATAHRRLRA